MQGLTEQEAAVYDRQLRVWGVETQKRLSSSKILILGCTGLAAEVAKNIVLAGMGSVTLVDNTPCSSRAPGNFLVAANADLDQTVAEACVATLQEMNPFVQLSSLPGSVADALSKERLAQFDLVLLCGQHSGVVAAADKLCTEAGVAFYAAQCRGISGWVFANLHEHDYLEETSKELADGTTSKLTKQRHAAFAPWGATMACSLKGMKLRRANKLYFVLRVCAELEAQQGRAVGPQDVGALREALAGLREEQGLGQEVVDEQLLESYASCPGEMPAVAAIVGGVLANDLLKAVAYKGEPLHNLFMYSLTDGVGSVEPYGC